MRFTQATEDEVLAVMRLYNDYFAKENCDPIPTWYAEAILAVYSPSLAPSLARTREVLQSEDLPSYMGILFLSSIHRSAPVESLKRKGLSVFLVAMFTMWKEFSRSRALTVCSKCVNFTRCPIPRCSFLLDQDQIENPRPLLEAHNEMLIGQTLLDPYTLSRLLVDIKECLLLNGEERPTNEATSELLQDSGKSALELLDSVLEQTDGEEDTGTDGDVESLNVVDFPKIQDSAMLYDTANIYKHSQKLKKDAGVSTNLIDPDGDQGGKIGLDEIEFMSDKLLEPQVLFLPDELYQREMLAGEPIYGIRPIHHSKTSINLVAYIDLSGSMQISQSIITAIATGCALLDVFAPYGRVKIIPFSETPLFDIGYESKHETNASKKWLTSVCHSNTEGAMSVVAGSGGTEIQKVLLKTEKTANLSLPGYLNYMVLVTDAEDLTTSRLPGYFSRLKAQGISVNSIMISRKRTAPLVQILDSHTLLQLVTPEDFRAEAPKLLKKIAMNYRERR